LLGKIEHIAIHDVGAGYDIKSFELPNIQFNKKIRYIEIKAVSLINYHFHMSKGEMNTATYYGEQYYLYLLPVIGREKFDIHNLKIIKNPMKVLMHNEKQWHVEVENLSFQMI